ncbi:MAG: peroxide stress protein YaaA [Rikenellaceae bacterium]
MITLISPAKTMNSREEYKQNFDSSQPRFLEQSGYIVSLMVQYSSAELSEIFKISAPIAQQLKSRFLSLVSASQQDTLPSVESYDGVVYKHFKREFTEAESRYLQQHLRISSLLYGLLRPFDQIKPYRMEGFVRLSGSDKRVDQFWRDHQTQTLIEDVKGQGGVLLYLASKEEQNSFHWKEVKKSVRVIEPLFLQSKGDKLRQVVIYTKMARGEMLRYMVDNSIEDVDELKAFEWGGYQYRDDLSTEGKWVWVME